MEKARPSRGSDANPVYWFPSRSRCRRCHSVSTRAYSKRGRIQYRLCRGCGHHYQVVGQKA